jgi:mRNA-degrading endonuclease toxin of MazEF toxin-antitoxin module
LIEQGEVYRFDFGPQQQHLQEGKRFLVVVQTDALNRIDGYHLVMVVPTTTKGRPSPSYAKIEPSEANGLTQTSFAICNQVQTFDKARLLQRVGKISKADLYLVKEALKVAFAIA